MKNTILKTIGKSALLVAILIVIAGAAYGILYACGFTSVGKFIELKGKMGESVGFWAVVVALQTFQVVFIPISNQIISAPLSILFSNELWKVCLSSFIGIEIGTIILFMIGRFGGTKVLNFILGDKEKTEHCKKFMQKGRAFYPLGMIIFIIPDDCLTTLAGVARYNFFYVLVVSIITRGICVAASVFGIGYATKYPWLWFVLAFGLSCIAVFTVFYFKRTIKENKNNVQN